MRYCRRQLSCVVLGAGFALSATVAVAQTNTTTTTSSPAIPPAANLVLPQFDTSLGILQSVTYQPRLAPGPVAAASGSQNLNITSTATGNINVLPGGAVHTHTVGGNFGSLLGVNLGTYSRDTRITPVSTDTSPGGTSSEATKSSPSSLLTIISVNSHSGGYAGVIGTSFTFNTADTLTAIAAGSTAATGTTTSGTATSGSAQLDVYVGGSLVGGSVVGGTLVADNFAVPHTHAFTPNYNSGTTYTYIPSASTLVDSVQTYHDASVANISMEGAGRTESIGLNGHTLNLTATGTQVKVLGNNSSLSIAGSAGSRLNTNGSFQIGENAFAMVDANLAGTNGLSLVGGGRLRLGGTESNEFAGQTTVSGGRLELNKASGATAISGNVRVTNSGILQLVRSNQISDTATVTIEFETQLTVNGGVSETIGALTNSRGATAFLGANSSLTVAPASGVSSFGGTITGAATSTLVKDGEGTWTLTGIDSNTRTGLTRVNGGVLRLSKNSGVTAIAGNAAIGAGGTLQLFGNTQMFGNEQIADTSTVSNDGGLFDVGSRTETIASLNQLSAESRTTIASGGALHVGTISNAGLIEVATGGALSATEISNSGTIVNNGNFTGNLTLENGGTLSGVGTVVGDLVVGNGGVLAPGNSPGRLTQMGDVTFMPGGSFLFQVNDALGTAGNDPGWSLNVIVGLLDLSSLSLSAPFTIDVTSLTLGNVAGLAENFDKLSNYRWRFLSAVGGIQGFDTAAFSVSLDNFQNDWTGGRFFVSRTANFLFLNYEAARLPEPQSAPEPASLAIFAAAFAGFFGINSRRRRSSLRGGLATRQDPWRRKRGQDLLLFLAKRFCSPYLPACEHDSSTRVTRAVQPVWWLAPRPEPSSPWKNS